MSSVLAEPSVKPRVDHFPPAATSEGLNAARMVAMFGLDLDDWQKYVLHRALGRREANGRDLWAAPEVGIVVPRQNGKGAVLEARAIYGLWGLGERLIIWTAHEYKTAREAFLRVRDLVEGSPFADHIKTIRTANGEESIELHGGQRLRFLARTSGSGRGFSGDCVILDEAYKLSGEQMAAMMPTMMARPDPQLWYASMAGKEDSDQLERVRDRAVAEEDRLCYLEFSAGASDDHDGKNVDLDDPAEWQRANPGMPHRISVEAMQQARAALSDEDFAREHLCLWGRRASNAVIDPDVWRELADPSSNPTGTVTFAVDVPPERNSASIAVAGVRGDGRWHVEVIDRQTGTGWAVDRIAELVEKWKPSGVLLDPGSPAGSLIPGLAKAGVEPVLITGREMAQAAGGFYDAVQAGTLRHIGQPALNVAVDAGRKRTVGDAWAWHRRDTSTDIAPLVAVTLALHGANKPGEKKRERSGKAAFY